MYMIVAVVYMIIAGQPYGEPIRVNHRDTFTSLEACQEHLKSDKFAADRQQLSSRIEASFVQMRKEADAEDQPLPALAITASCEQDARV